MIIYDSAKMTAVLRMNDSEFSRGFIFRELSYSRYSHTDNRRGVNCHYIGFMREGSGRLVGSDRTVDVETGAFLYIPKECSYQSYWQGIPIVRFDSYGFDTFPHSDAYTYPLQRIEATPEALEYLEKLAADKRVSCTSIGLLYQLLGCLLEHMEAVPVSRHRAVIAQAESYMRSHEHFLIPDVARHCGVSESALYAIFRAEQGCTPITAKHRIQVEKAISLLRNTDMSVENISDALGFSSTPYFRKVFLQETGKRPRDVRKERLI